jgi:hypothetical protein
VMNLGRLAVTLLGLGLIVAVNLYFFARPRGGRRKPGTRPEGADETGKNPAGRG